MTQGIIKVFRTRSGRRRRHRRMKAGGAQKDKTLRRQDKGARGGSGITEQDKSGEGEDVEHAGGTSKACIIEASNPSKTVSFRRG